MIGRAASGERGCVRSLTAAVPARHAPESVGAVAPAHRVVQPASTVNSRPVTYRASSEARNNTALLTSRGSMGSTASAFMKIGPRFGSLASSEYSAPRPVPIGVFTPVGWTVLTLMLCLASSFAIDLARPTTPCLAATYGAKNGRPLIPAVELMQMIDPPSSPVDGQRARRAQHQGQY